MSDAWSVVPCVKLWPGRPDVTDPRARWWLDWVQTAAYTFWTLVLAVALVIALIKGLDAADLGRFVSLP